MFFIPFIERLPVIGITRNVVPHHGGVNMKQYFTLKVADYASIEAFGVDIVGVLNSNFSNLQDAERETIGKQGVKNLLTFPEQAFCGDKYCISRNGTVFQPRESFFVGYDGTVNPTIDADAGEEAISYQECNSNYGHHVVELSAIVLEEVHYFVAKSGSSGSTITIEVTLDRFRKPQAAICRLETPDGYFGYYGRHFMEWAEAHNIVPKEGKW
jgi:hypothetical protein